MPTTPRSSATDAAIASMTSMNEVWAIDSDAAASSVRTLATGRLAFTDQTAC